MTYRAAITAKNPDFEGPEFPVSKTLRAPVPRQKKISDPKPFYVAYQCDKLDLNTP